MKLLLTLMLASISITSFSQRCPENWKPWEWDLNDITLKICIQPNISMGQQSVFWGVQNKTQDKLHVVFEKVTTLTCGNVKVRKASIYLKPGEFLGGGHFSGDLDLADAFFSEDCDAKARIRNVNYRGLQITNISANERAKQAQVEAEKRQAEAARQQAQAERANEDRRQQMESQKNSMAQQKKSTSDANAKARLPETPNLTLFQQNLNDITQFQNSVNQNSANDADPIMSALSQQLSNLSNTTTTNNYKPTSPSPGAYNYLNSTSQSTLTDNVTALASGVISLLDMGARNKQLRMEQENLRRADEAAEREQARQIALIEAERLNKIKAEQDLAKSRLQSFFSITRLPDEELSVDSIFFVVMQNSGNKCIISKSPIKVFKTLNDKWPNDYLIKRFSGATGPEGISAIKLSGYYMDILSAELALNQIIKIAPLTGDNISMEDWRFDDVAMNEYIKEEQIKAIKLERMVQIQLKMDTLFSSLEKFSYPTFATKEDSLSYFIISYTNSPDSLYLGISNQITLKKYSDKSWPLKSDFWNQVKHSFNHKAYKNNHLIGYYNPSDCARVIETLRNLLSKYGISITTLTINSNSQKSPILTNEFWNTN